MKLKLLSKIVFLIIPSVFFGQVSETGRLGNGLVFYCPFDGSSAPNITLKRIYFSEDNTKSSAFVTANLNYSNDQGLSLTDESSSFISYLDLEDKPEKRNATFWFRLSDNKSNTISKSVAFENLKVYFSNDKSLVLKTALIKDKLSLILEKQKDSTTTENLDLVHLKKETWYLLSVSLNNTENKYEIKLFTASKKGVNEEGISSQRELNNFISEHLIRTKLNPNLYIILESALSSSIAVNDLRIYDRILDDIDYRKMSSYTIDNYLEIAKYELAYTYKKIGDELFMKDDTLGASSNYDKAANMFKSDLPKSINYENLEEVNSLYSIYYKLLAKDIEYRQSLLIQGYSFWGQDFSTTPLFPVNELESFKETYKNFEEVYGDIEKSVDVLVHLTKEQMKQNISRITRTYESSIANAHSQQKNYNIDFYKFQEDAITSRLSQISTRNKQIESQVKNYNTELTENDSKINGIVSSMVTQSVTGVPIDPSKDLASNLKSMGTSILTNNPELRNTILSSQNDFVNLTSLSIDYYQKSKKSLNALNTVVKQGVSPDNLITIGNTLSNLEIIPNDQWRILEGRYQHIKNNYLELQKFESDARKIIESANFLKNPNLNNVSQFMDWMANSEYFPEGKNYSDIYSQVCENMRRKKYDAFYELGSQLLEKSTVAIDIQKNISNLKTKYNQAKPIASIIEHIEKDINGNITTALGDIVFNKDFWPQIKDFKVQAFMMTAISNTLSLDGDLEIKKKLLNALFSQTPDISLSFIPAKAKENIKILHDIKDDNELISKLKQTVIISDQSAHGLTIYVDKIELFKIERDSIIVGGEKFMFIYNNIEKKSYDYLSVLNKLFSETSLRAGVLKNMKISEWYSFLGPGSISNPELIYEKVIDKLQIDGKSDLINAIKTDGLKTYIGANISKSYMDDTTIPKAIPMMNPDEFYEVNAPDDVKDDATREMAANAINMAFPGYGTLANQGLKIAGNILDSYDIVNNLKDLYKEQQSLHRELLEQIEKLRANSFDKKIAFFEKDIADLNLELANRQKEEFSKMEFDMIADEQIEGRNQLSLQLPVFFYYTERMRYYYNRLFKASTFWYGKKNTLNDIIETDQSNIRLALDQSINLFNWIKQPDVSSMRQDIKKIENYWRSKYTLINDPETERKIKYGNKDISTHSFRIDKNCTIISNQWNDFTNWKEMVRNGQKVKDFEFDVDMQQYLSDNINDYDKSDIEPIVIDIAFVAINSKSSIVDSPGSILEICHPGISIGRDGSISVLKEKNSTKTASEIKIGSDGKVIIVKTPVSVQERWESKNYKEKDFEGYDLEAKWKIKVKGNKSSAEIDDIILQISYQYSHGNAIPEQRPPTSYRISIEYNQHLKQEFRMDLTPEKAKSMRLSLNEAEKNKKIISGDITEIINKNGTQDVLIK